MKILFVMNSPEYLRFYDSAIEELAARGHAVAIAVRKEGAKKPVGLEGLQAYADRVTVLGMVPKTDGLWGEIAYALRGTMDFVRYLHPRFAAAPALRARMKRKGCPPAYRWLDRIRTLRPETVRTTERALAAADRAIPVNRSILEFLRAESPDVLLVSPLVEVASEQVDWIKAARRLGISSRTLRNHLAELRLRLGVRTSAQAVYRLMLDLADHGSHCDETEHIACMLILDREPAGS